MPLVLLIGKKAETFRYGEHADNKKGIANECYAGISIRVDDGKPPDIGLAQFVNLITLYHKLSES